MIQKIVLKSVLWRGSESARYFCIFQLLCFSLHPTSHMYVYTHSVDSFQHLRCEERQFSGSFCNSAGWLLDQGIGAMLANTTMGHCAASHWSYGDVTLAGSTPSNASLNFCQPLYYLLKPKMKSFQDRWTCWSTSYFFISLNWWILLWVFKRYIFKMRWSIAQIFLINSYSYIILIPLFFQEIALAFWSAAQSKRHARQVSE